MATFVKIKNAPKSIIMTSGSKSFAHILLKPLLSLNKWKVGKRTGGQVVSFLIKIIALEAVRRLSKARCPFVWNGLQALQVLCYPPFKSIQRWNPFRKLIKGMQNLSRPLLVLSIVNALSEPSDCSKLVLDDDTDNSPRDDDFQLSSESHLGSLSLNGTGDENHQAVQPTDWMHHLSEELENLGITLPERIHKRELQRFYVAANGNLSSLLSSVKKTIIWRETYRIMSVEELETWSHMIFWHGLDVKGRPCLIIRLGMVCTLPSKDRPCYVQAVISQVEHGVVNLVDEEEPQMTVLLDCLEISPLKFPMKMLRQCSNLLQDHYPNVLGSLIIIRLPPVVRVITQTFIKVLKPVTKQKLRIEGLAFKKVLNECFQTLPSYLGGQCTCARCAKFGKGNVQKVPVNKYIASTEPHSDFINAKDFPSEQPTNQYDGMMVNNNCSRVVWTALIGILIVWLLFAYVQSGK